MVHGEWWFSWNYHLFRIFRKVDFSKCCPSTINFLSKNFHHLKSQTVGRSQRCRSDVMEESLFFPSNPNVCWLSQHSHVVALETVLCALRLWICPTWRTLSKLAFQATPLLLFKILVLHQNSSKKRILMFETLVNRDHPKYGYSHILCIYIVCNHVDKIRKYL